MDFKFVVEGLGKLVDDGVGDIDTDFGAVCCGGGDDEVVVVVVPCCP